MKAGAVKNTFNAGLKSFQRKLRTDVEAGMLDAMGAVVDLAKDYVPVVSGELRDSGGVRLAGGDAVGEFTAQYAANVHENPQSEGFGFLERAGDDVAPQIADIVAAKARVGP